MCKQFLRERTKGLIKLHGSVSETLVRYIMLCVKTFHPVASGNKQQFAIHFKNLKINFCGVKLTYTVG